MDLEEKNYCANILNLLATTIDAPSLQKISQMTSAPNIVYGYLYQHPEGATPTDLAKQCGCMPSRITAIVAKAKRAKLVECFHQGSDRRCVYIRLTENGRAVFEEYFNGLISMVALVRNHFGEERMQSFLADMNEAIMFIKAVKKREVIPCFD